MKFNQSSQVTLNLGVLTLNLRLYLRVLRIDSKKLNLKHCLMRGKMTS